MNPRVDRKLGGSCNAANAGRSSGSMPLVLCGDCFECLGASDTELREALSWENVGSGESMQREVKRTEIECNWRNML
jgi:hypothetical protein